METESTSNPLAAHAKAWEKGFIVPIAKEMKARGVAYMLITIRDDGKAAYVLEPKAQGETQPPPPCPEIDSLDDLIAAIRATEGNGDMVSGTFGPSGFEGKIVSSNDQNPSVPT